MEGNVGFDLMEDVWEPRDVIRNIVEMEDQDDSFYVMDVGEVVTRFRRWEEVMPRVEPFYAVKCNNDKQLLGTLAAFGANFDCASKGEIEQVIALGVDPNRIIFAHPTKMATHIRYSSVVGVKLMTFDSEPELFKIKAEMPHAQMVIRIRCDAEEAQCPLGAKFGCDSVTEAPLLLEVAAALQIEVVGVSFHIGSGSQDFEAYDRAIRMARDVFDKAASLGHAQMKLLDIGGGFPGTRDDSINKVALVVNDALTKYFPEPDIKVIAEPGRYFAEAAYTLAVQVFAKREISVKCPEKKFENETMYFINDGIYGSFGDVIFCRKQIYVEPLKPSTKNPQRCSIWGPSADAIDCVVPSAQLPALSVGDWLMVRDMGAYSVALATTFNGFPIPRVRAVVDRQSWSILQNVFPAVRASQLKDGHQLRETSAISLRSSFLPSTHETASSFLNYVINKLIYIFNQFN